MDMGFMDRPDIRGMTPSHLYESAQTLRCSKANLPATMAGKETMKLIFNVSEPPANQPFFQPQGVITMSNRDAYIAKMKLQLDELDAKMDALEAKAKEAKADAREKYQEEMAKLRHQSKLAKGKLEEMKAATEDAWETTVAEMEKIRDAFTHSFSYFKSQL
jgi:hypothetical protein